MSSNFYFDLRVFPSRADDLRTPTDLQQPRLVVTVALKQRHLCLLYLTPVSLKSKSCFAQRRYFRKASPSWRLTLAKIQHVDQVLYYRIVRNLFLETKKARERQ